MGNQTAVRGRLMTMKRITRVFLSVFAVLALVVACGSDDAGSGQKGDGPDGRWILDSLVLEGDMAIPLPDRAVELTIDGDTLGGDGGCNSIGGTASFDSSGELTIGEMFWTEMACFPAEVMQFEGRYTSALLAATSWQVDDERLTLRGPGVEIAYTPRVAPPDLPITATTWRLDTFFDGDAAMNAVDMDEVTVQFSDTGVQMSGRCWTISGFATVEPGGEGNLSTDFTTADPGFTCDDRSFFADMMDRMSTVTEYEIVESRLTLATGSGPVLGMRGDS